MTVTKQWADGPFKLIPGSATGYKKDDKVKDCHLMAEEMIIVHNTLLRSINSVYLQCVNVERDPAVVADFVRYAQTWGEVVHEHHSAEEEYVFPSIEQVTATPGLMAENVAQHEVFHAGLDSYGEYLEKCKTGEEKYDGKKLRAIIDSFMPVLRQHLEDEITTLVGLDKFEASTDWLAWFKAEQKKVVDKVSAEPGVKLTVFPMAIQNHDKTFDDGMYTNWPPLPWIATLIFKWYYIPKHKGWWRFAPCDTNGIPRDMPYVD